MGGGGEGAGVKGPIPLPNLLAEEIFLNFTYLENFENVFACQDFGLVYPLFPL